MLNELRTLRKNAKITQAEMAEKLGVCKQLYSQIEREDIRLDYGRAVQIAAIFNTTPDKIFLSEKSNAVGLASTGTDNN